MTGSPPRKRPPSGSLAISIVIHVIAIAVLLQIAFKIPLGQLSRLAPESRERLQYVEVPPRPPEHSGSSSRVPEQPEAAPAPLVRPDVTPTTVPDPVPLDSAPARSVDGTGSGFGVSNSTLATGLVPRQPDPRIRLNPGGLARVPRSMAEDVDSIVQLAIGIVRDSLQIAAGQRRPGDWTFKGKGGTWGWDENGIRLGKFTIPQALLALLPLNAGSRVGPIEARSIEWIRRDIRENAERSISEDEFRAAVKRIRERKDRERRQQQLAADGKDPEKPTP